jgi:uncharacterized protein (TIGR02246 family)
MLSSRRLWFAVPIALAVAGGAFQGDSRWTALSAARAQTAPQTGAQAKSQPAATDSQSQDRAAVRAALEAFVKSFESRDPKALVAFWTAGGEFQNARGVQVKGRDDLQQAFTALFSKTPELKAELHPESLRFLSRDLAIEEGSATVRRGSVAPTTKTGYTAILVREDGRWLLAKLTESEADAETVADLAWLIGEWKSSVGQAAEIKTTYSWAPSKKFINVQFSIKEKELTIVGTQVIGVDPATGSIHTWTFEADGGVGETEWSRDGDHWLLEATGTLVDGRTLTETNILRRVNDDTFTWQSIDRWLDDDELPDLPPVKVTRVKPAGGNNR